MLGEGLELPSRPRRHARGARGRPVASEAGAFANPIDLLGSVTAEDVCVSVLPARFRPSSSCALSRLVVATAAEVERAVDSAVAAAGSGQTRRGGLSSPNEPAGRHRRAPAPHRDVRIAGGRGAASAPPLAARPGCAGRSASFPSCASISRRGACRRRGRARRPAHGRPGSTPTRARHGRGLRHPAPPEVVAATPGDAVRAAAVSSAAERWSSSPPSRPRTRPRPEESSSTSAAPTRCAPRGCRSVAPVLVQPMLEGAELPSGVVHDPHLRPARRTRLGGVLAELVGAVSIAIASSRC